ncbi:MAG: hypothetical protein ISP90_02760 [Nevskia sp.]|nr:hypothetical protein [Nevskia sp.]
MTKPDFGVGGWAGAVLCITFAWCAAAIAAEPAPAADKHLGVASCAGSTCHGAVRPFADSPIRQDEYFIWQRKDFHTRAYATLLTPRSDAITRRLGLGRARDAQECLVCHAENTPAPQRGERYQVSDGIGCEACHGASEHWIGPHVAGYKSNPERVAAGLYPTWDPMARGRLCAACHVGDDAHAMSHAIMAAGHPPLLFELDTFTTLEPPHWHVDAAYVARKGSQDPAHDWVAGQVEGSRVILRNLAGPRLAGGVFPELALFDCNACHHSLKAGRGRPQRSGGLPPGAVPLADAHLVMLMRWLDVADPALGAQWRAGWSTLHASTLHDPAAIRQQAQAMLALLDDRVAARARQAELSDRQLRDLLRGVVSDARGDHAGDFSDAEHTAMAVSVLTTALSQRGTQQVSAALRMAVDRLYAEVHDRDRFQPESYRVSVENVALALGLAQLPPKPAAD